MLPAPEEEDEEATGIDVGGGPTRYARPCRPVKPLEMIAVVGIRSARHFWHCRCEVGGVVRRKGGARLAGGEDEGEVEGVVLGVVELRRRGRRKGMLGKRYRGKGEVGEAIVVWCGVCYGPVSRRVCWRVYMSIDEVVVRLEEALTMMIVFSYGRSVPPSHFTVWREIQSPLQHQKRTLQPCLRNARRQWVGLVSPPGSESTA